jgi:predicted MFS family arabinose efflux permease
MSTNPSTFALRTLTPDGRLLFLTRGIRLFAYGFLAVVLVLYLSALGLSDGQVGVLLTLILLGDTAISLWITTAADRLGRKRMLLVGSILMALSGVIFAMTDSFWLLLVAGTIGVISPSGNEVGPFLSVEHAAIAQTVPAQQRTAIFAWHNMTGTLATAVGSLCGGVVAKMLQARGVAEADSYRPVVIAYGVAGLVLAVLFSRLSPRAEVQFEPKPLPASESVRSRFGLHRSRGTVYRLAALFALDAFGGGFVMQGVVAYWFHVRFGADPATIGAIFFGANVLAACSALAAAWVARHIGLLNAMVFTHLPSNVLLLLVPLMPDLPLAVAVLLLRFSISQMDVPTRQSYTVAVVSPDERSAASGVTGVARSIGAAVSPMLATALIGVPSLAGVPFYLGGGIKIVYDLLLYRRFAAIRPPEEEQRGPQEANKPDGPPAPCK